MKSIGPSRRPWGTPEVNSYRLSEQKRFYQNPYKTNDSVDRTLIENWRPISLVYADPKIITKVIANRIKDLLPSIIHHNETGYVKEGYIGEMVRWIFDIMDLTDKENMPGLLIFIDFEKAFNALEWNFLYVFNFGLNFKRWIKSF